MSVLYIKNLVITARHGVHQAEKDQAQPFSVSVEATIDTSVAGQSDELDDTLNWSWLRKTIIDTVENNSFNLMEKLAQTIADQIMNDERITKIVVLIDKLEAFESGVPGIRLEISRRN